MTEGITLELAVNIIASDDVTPDYDELRAHREEIIDGLCLERMAGTLNAIRREAERAQCIVESSDGYLSGQQLGLLCVLLWGCQMWAKGKNCNGTVDKWRGILENEQQEKGN
jgi:hypothetical protein